MPSPGRTAREVVAAAAVAGLLLSAAAAAVDAATEAQAPSLRADIVAAGHQPAVVAAHTQWSGFLRFAATSNVTGADYQICRVGAACFAPPAPARRVGEAFWFNTSEYLAGGRPVDFQAGWELGVQWILHEGGNRSELFPQGSPAGSTACGDAMACAATHYIVVEVAGTPASAPSPSLALVAAALVVAAAWGRGRRTHG